MFALLSISVEILLHVMAAEPEVEVELDSFTVLVLPAGHTVLLGRSSGLDPTGAVEDVGREMVITDF